MLDNRGRAVWASEIFVPLLGVNTMRIPVMRGVIERRILANFHVDADVMARWLPSPFRPQ